jgi:hypothetical protein
MKRRELRLMVFLFENLDSHHIVGIADMKHLGSFTLEPFLDKDDFSVISLQLD